MELVYLWTESFKNLKGGYKLSSKYDIDFKNNTIEIQINKNHIESFFSNNPIINISAIIGENGSGKSSLLKLILLLLYQNYIGITTKKTSLLVIEINNKFHIISLNITPSLKINGLTTKYKQYKNKFYSIYFNYMLDSLKDSSKDEWIDEIYHKSDDYTMPILLEPYKKDNNIDINNLNYLTRQRMILYRNKIKQNNFLKNIYNPIKTKINIDINKILKAYKSTYGKYIPVIKKHYKNYFKGIDKYIYKIKQVESNIQKQDITKTRQQESLNKIKEWKYKIKYIFEHYIPLYVVNNLYIANKIDKYHSIKRDIFTPGIDGFSFSKNKIQIQINDKSHNTLKLRNALKYHDLILEKKDFSKKELSEYIDIMDTRLENLPSWFEISFYDDIDRTFTSLSAGEKSIYILLISIIYQINNLTSRQNHLNGSYENLLIILDEADLGLHPKWQRQYLFNIIETLKEEKKLNYQIICTSHSPFIISDLPKENILFLDKGHVTNLKEHEHTFGENIHTLLNDSFFMKKDMMMGQIAENTIRKEFEFFEEIFQQNHKLEKSNKKNVLQKLEKLKEKYIQKRDYLIKLQKIIGEEYLRIAFKNSLEECDLIFNMNNLSYKDAKEKIIMELENNPQLAEKWLKELKS